MQNQTNGNSQLASKLMEEFEALARSVKSSKAAHTFSAAQGVTVVWDAPLNCFRNSVAQAALCHNPTELPAPGERFMGHVDRLRCKEVVYSDCETQVAFTQHWNFVREGHLERYSFTRRYPCSAGETAVLVFDTKARTSEAKRSTFGLEEAC